MVRPGFASYFPRKLNFWIVALALVVGCSPATAQIGSDRYSSIVIDSQSGQIVSAANPDEYRFPASLTKMMTMYLVFEALRDRKITLFDLVPVSAWACTAMKTTLPVGVLWEGKRAG